VKPVWSDRKVRTAQMVTAALKVLSVLPAIRVQPVQVVLRARRARTDNRVPKGPPVFRARKARMEPKVRPVRPAPPVTLV
jgi:hypothetical protein